MELVAKLLPPISKKRYKEDITALGKENGKKDRHPSFGHCQWVLEKDKKRMADLGVTSIFSAYWMGTEPKNEYTYGEIGPPPPENEKVTFEDMLYAFTMGEQDPCFLKMR